jgi:hypothetical protein
VTDFLPQSLFFLLLNEKRRTKILIEVVGFYAYAAAIISHDTTPTIAFDDAPAFGINAMTTKIIILKLFF